MAFPTHPSNRHLVNTMLAWGWMHDKSRSDQKHWHMTWPASNTAVRVVAPGYKGQNHNDIINQIMTIQFGIAGNPSLERFWNKAPAHTPENVKGITPLAVVLDETNLRVEEIKALPLKERAKRVQSNRGAASTALQVLIAAGTPLNAQSICARAQSSTISQKAMGNALSYLHTIGLVDRVIRGTYRAHVDLLPHTGRVRHDVTQHAAYNDTGAMPTILGPVPEPAPVARVESVPEPVPVPEPAPPAPAREIARAISTQVDIEDDIDAVLDMLCPNGFKASQLKDVLRWREETAIFIRKIRSS